LEKLSDFVMVGWKGHHLAEMLVASLAELLGLDVVDKKAVKLADMLADC